MKTMTDHNFAGLAAELETAKWNLMLTGDTAGLASILSDELYYVHSSGVQDNKKTYLEKVGNRTFIYRRLDNRTGPMPSLGENAFSVHGIAEVLSREARASDGVVNAASSRQGFLLAVPSGTARSLSFSQGSSWCFPSHLKR